MKKLLSVILLFALLVSGIAALAEEETVPYDGPFPMYVNKSEIKVFKKPDKESKVLQKLKGATAVMPELMTKDGEWLGRMCRDHIRMAHMMSRAKGYPGRIMPGEHRNPDGEFKAGCVHSEEDRRKISEGNRRNWMLHKRERRAKIRRTRGLDDEEKTAFVS